MRRLVPTLPEIEEGVVNGVLGKEAGMSRVESSIDTRFRGRPNSRVTSRHLVPTLLPSA
jgi:hypothetical protein